MVDGWCSEDGGAVVFGGEVAELVALLDGWVTEARNHTGLAVAATEGGQGGMRERGMCNQAPRGSNEMARDLTPLDQICHFAILPSYFSSFFQSWSSHLELGPLKL